MLEGATTQKFQKMQFKTSQYSTKYVIEWSQKFIKYLDITYFF